MKWGVGLAMAILGLIAGLLAHFTYDNLAGTIAGGVICFIGIVSISSS